MMPSFEAIAIDAAQGTLRIHADVGAADGARVGGSLR